MTALDISVEELLESSAAAANFKYEREEKRRRSSAASTDLPDRSRKSHSREPSSRDAHPRDPPRGNRGHVRAGESKSYRQDPSADKQRRGDRDGDGDEDMKHGSDKASANGSERSRRDRSPESTRRAARAERFGDDDGDSRHRRSGGRDRSRSPADDLYRPGGRYARDERYPSGRRTGRRDGSRDRHRDFATPDVVRSRDRDYRDRDDRRDRAGPPRAVSRRTPELTDDERDRRTVFVQQLAARLRTKELEAFFSQVGPVKEAQIVKDRVSGRSKGVGYVEFREEESVEKAIKLTGQKLLGIPIIAQLTEAEKNRQARNVEGVATQSNGIPFHRLYVGNIHFSVTEDDLKDVFSPFGELEFTQLQKEDMGRSKGYGFVQFVDPANAKSALSEMNGFEIAGRPIRVGLGNDKFTPETTANLLQRFHGQAQAQAFQGSSFSGAGGRGAHAGGKDSFDRASGRDEKGTGGASALDDSDVGGVNFSNFSRDSLMRKLARTEDPTPAAPTSSSRARADPRKAAVHSTAPSRCVVVKNCYNEAEETDPDWVADLESDFRAECSDSYGPVAHVGLFRDSNDGEIYVKFVDIKGGENALKGLNGRFFGGRTLTAQPVVDAVYNMNFPKAANV